MEKLRWHHLVRDYPDTLGGKGVVRRRQLIECQVFMPQHFQITMDARQVLVTLWCELHRRVSREDNLSCVRIADAAGAEVVDGPCLVSGGHHRGVVEVKHRLERNRVRLTTCATRIRERDVRVIHYGRPVADDMELDPPDRLSIGGVDRHRGAVTRRIRDDRNAGGHGAHHERSENQQQFLHVDLLFYGLVDGLAESLGEALGDGLALAWSVGDGDALAEVEAPALADALADGLADGCGDGTNQRSGGGGSTDEILLKLSSTVPFEDGEIGR